ncbi:hypothetical protein SAMN02745181_3534 [Rubritalea squalenifaciens DSM 18772]|uniref:DUF3153 domain-containing protein n=1 Tax=Rubritalea squalenifaciens DSM 18772 TaxID=1123071 RepID=A0A1M6R356_9BACT|nr:hypothetical protein [Rubritalea squalenifaciens]SHK26872.1 hypothetical protein SAMN02745181_3534 [Rubritalea squalenifaciens DSM 18772]
MRLSLLRLVYAIALCTLCCLSSSCLDGQEEITVLEDGSGSAQISYNIPTRALNEDDATSLEVYLNKIADKHDSLKLTHFSKSASGFGMQRIEARLEFTSIIEVAEIYENELCGPEAPKLNPEMQALLDKACALMGKFEVSVRGLDIDIKREVNLKPLFEGKIKNPEILGESEFRYILHLPKAVSDSNATLISEDKKSLQWSIKLKNYVNQPIIMQSSIPLPWWIPASLVAILFIILLGFIWLIRRIRQKKDTTAADLPCPDSPQ